MTGLRWLARLAPTPMDVWALCDGLGLRTAQSHSQRLQREDLRRYAMARGNGALWQADDELVVFVYVVAATGRC